ncbi:MAG: hypothetical protein NVS9B4_27460 [Candidatus Acidiferrum sp.]
MPVYCANCGGTVNPCASFCTACGRPALSSATGTLPGLTPAPSAATPASDTSGSLPPIASTPSALSAYAHQPYAGFWLRLVAHLIDSVILGTGALALFIPIALLSGMSSALSALHPGVMTPDEVTALMSGGFALGISLIFLIAVVGGWLYFALMESSSWEGTLGKKILSLRVSNLSGAHVSFAQASARYFSKIISGLIPFGVGYIIAGFTEKKQAVHDMIASCLVLRKS